MFHVPEPYRHKEGLLRSDASFGNNGAFAVTGLKRVLWCIASDCRGWEHVSVHASDGRRNCVPTWAEMCRIKDLFWDPEDVVMQLHPRQSRYVNEHEHTLHLWRPTSGSIPEPPAVLVGRVGS
jgi:hypothetical protein